MSGFTDKLTKAFEKLPSTFSKLKEGVHNTLVPDHRHDESFEIENDRARSAIANSHRFQSFAPERDGCAVKWYLQGHDYFWAISEMIENAKESIIMEGWWISPELMLRRPLQEEYRLDRLLLRKAQEGVHIYIIVYKEVELAASMSSEHTKHALEALHPNIAVVRHPDHTNGEVTLLWSHHEKAVIVDFCMAAVGGLDLCFGRWDTHNSPCADVHPTDFQRTLFPGVDYNNARIKDFQHVEKWVSNQISRLDTARMPWQDAHVTLAGPVVLDIAQHLVERWNFIRGLKYKHDSRYPILAFPHVPGEEDKPPEPILRHPNLHRWKEAGKQYLFHTLTPAQGGSIPFGGVGPKGNMRVQVVRSSADWSHGILTEHSIQNAYCQLIAEASHFIYIENQFFCTSTKSGVGAANVKNTIGAAIVARVLSAARAGHRFKVVITIPAIPGFSGDLHGNSSVLAILGATYASLCRGGNSIFELIAKAGFDPNEYISVFSLRSYDRLNVDPARLSRMTQASGVTFDQAQAALARVQLGKDATAAEVEANAHITFVLGEEGGEVKNIAVSKKPNSQPPTVKLELPKSYDEALEIMRRFESSAPVEEEISDSVSHHALQNTGSLLDEAWHGSEESERLAYVCEELYIHTKTMVVDDRRVIIGSANLNDRSQLGNHDSEIALVIEDNESLASTMDGKPYMATRFAATFRRALWRQHLGLIEPQFCPHRKEAEAVTTYMRPVGTLDADLTQSQGDFLVADPLSITMEKLWKGTAARNTQAFENVFHCVPSKSVEDWKQYKAFVPQYTKPGHVFDANLPVDYIKRELDTICGHLVDFPLNFLKNEDLLKPDAAVNPVTMELYI